MTLCRKRGHHYLEPRTENILSKKFKILFLLAASLSYSGIYGCIGGGGNFANPSIEGDVDQAPAPADLGITNETSDGSGPPVPVVTTDGGAGANPSGGAGPLAGAPGEGGAPAGGGVGGARYAQHNPSGGTYSPGSEGHVAKSYALLVTVKSPEGIVAGYDTTSYDGKHCLRENEEFEIFPEQTPGNRNLKIFAERSNDPSRSDSWTKLHDYDGKNFFTTNGCGQTLLLSNPMVDFDPDVGNTTCQYAVRVWATYRRGGLSYRADPPTIITCQDLGAQVGDLTTKIKKPAVANLTLAEYSNQMYRQANILAPDLPLFVDAE